MAVDPSSASARGFSPCSRSVVALWLGLAALSGTIAGCSSEDESIDRLASTGGAVGQAVADLGVAITATPNPAGVQGLVTYGVTVTNSGPDGAVGPTFAASLVAVGGEINGVIETASAGCTLVRPRPTDPPNVECAVGPLAKGAVRTFEIGVRATALGTLRLRGGAADSATLDNNSANNAQVADALIVDSLADVAMLEARVSADPALVGKPMQFTLVSRNFGPAGAVSARVALAFENPTAVTAISATTDRGACTVVVGGVQCDLSVLPVTAAAAGPPGGGQDWTVVVTATPAVLGGLRALARVDSAITDVVEENNQQAIRVQVTDRGQVDLAVVVQDTPDPVAVGDVLTYTLPVTNAGPDTATQLVVDMGFVDRTGFTVLSATSPTGTCAIAPAGDPMVRCHLSDLGAAGATSVTVKVRPSATGAITTAALVDSYELDPVESNNSAQQTTTVVAASGADMAVTITDFPDPVDAGAELLYTVAVKNNGPQTAHHATLQFVIQGDIANVQTATPGCAVVGPSVQCLFSELTSGQMVPVIVTGRPTTAGGLLNAVALVDADENDAIEENDRDAEPTAVRGGVGVDLGTDVSDDPDPVLGGEVFEYTVRWYNAGTSRATTADAQFVIPPEASFLSFTQLGMNAGESCAFDAVNNRIDCVFNDFTPARVVVVKVLVEAAVLGGNGETIYTMTSAGLIDSRVEADTFEENDIDIEPTTVYVCKTDNPCLKGALVEGVGGWSCEFVPNNGFACEAPCYAPGVCMEGVCELGAPVVCPAGDNPCQVSQCNAATGACESVPVMDHTACTGADPCTVGQECIAGQCTGGTPKTCAQDANPCTVAVCDSETGACEVEFTTVACDDSNPCTTYDKCEAGSCKGGPTLSCDDGNVCTTDSCNPATANGCVFTPNTATCDDGNPCTTASVCDPATAECVGAEFKDCSSLSGACASGQCDPSTGECVAHAINDYVACDDGNACTGTPCGAQQVPYGASKTYVVSDASPFNSGEKSMGLWLPGFFCGAGGADAQVLFSFEPGASLVVGADHHATLSGVVKSIDLGGGPGELGLRYQITAHFSYRGKGFAADGSGGPKLLLGGLQTPALYSQWEYYNTVDAVMVGLDNPNDRVVLVERPANGVYPFQMGFSASGKNLNFGASVWFFYTRSGSSCASSGESDIFVDLSLGGCETVDRCLDGQCVPGPGISCDDSDGCTTDACDPVTGCTHEPVVCNDNDSCTTDACVASASKYERERGNDNDVCTTYANVDSGRT